jgi:hypothetical protein
LSCHSASVLSYVSSSVLSRTVMSRLWESVLRMQPAFVLRILVFVLVSYYVHSISLVSLGFSLVLSFVLSLVLSVLRCLIPAFFSSSYTSSESVYRPPRYVRRLIFSVEFVVLSSHPGSRHCRSRSRICMSRFVNLDSSHQVSSVLGSRFPAFGLGFCYHIPVFCDFVVKSVSRCLCFSSSCCCLVFKSWCLVSWYGCMFCGILYCFGFNWILVWNGHWKGKSVLKKGRDGRNSCTSCHSVTENCYPVLALSIPHPIPHPKKFSSVLSLLVPCHIRLSVYCPVPTFGLLHSV